MMLARLLLALAFFVTAEAAPVAVGEAELKKSQQAATNFIRAFTNGPQRRLRAFVAAQQAMQLQQQQRTTGRRLADAQCLWAGNNCTFNVATVVNTLDNAPADSIRKQMWDKCKPCVNKMDRQSCVSAATMCKWKADTAQCDCDVGEDMGAQAMDKAMGYKDSCGWVGKTMEAGSKCAFTPSDSCATTTGCEVGAESYEPPDNAKVGDTCSTRKSSCNPTDSAMMQSMCPGVTDVEAMTGECVEQLKASGSTEETDEAAVKKMMVDCIKGKCELFGTMVEAQMNDPCTELTNADGCTANQKCKWDADGPSCEADMEKLLMSSIPQACPVHMVVELSKKCSGDAQQSSSGACQTASECEWVEADESEECVESNPSRVRLVQSPARCNLKSDVMMWKIAEATGDSDIGMLATTMKTGQLCEAAKDEEKCIGVGVQTITLTPMPTLAPAAQPASGTMQRGSSVLAFIASATMAGLSWV